MGKRLRGGCLCGGVAYECTGEPAAAGFCHCADCRKCTGSAFNISVGVDAARFRLTRGTLKGFTKRGDSGNELTRHFCTECGSPIYTSSPHHPETIYLKAGSLDDPAAVKPGHQAWMRSRVSWSVIDSALPSFEKGR
jgi:hypothetical protein